MASLKNGSRAGHVEQLPEVLNSIPDLIKNQKQATEDLYELMRQTMAKDEQFVMSVERIPEETVRQTKALHKIDERLGASAGLDAQLRLPPQTIQQLEQRLPLAWMRSSVRSWLYDARTHRHFIRNAALTLLHAAYELPLQLFARKSP